MESVDSLHLDVIRAAVADGNGWLNAVGEHDSAVAGGVALLSLGESPGDGGRSLESGRPFALAKAPASVDVGEPRAENLSNEGSREVEDEDLGKSSMEVTSRRFIPR